MSASLAPAKLMAEDALASQQLDTGLHCRQILKRVFATGLLRRFQMAFRCARIFTSPRRGRDDVRRLRICCIMRFPAFSSFSAMAHAFSSCRASLRFRCRWR